MSCKYKMTVTTLVVLLNLLFAQQSIAHIMVAQHGTLNIAEDGVYMVLSLPVSAFSGIDDDNDGKLSQTEFSRHRPAIAKSVLTNVLLIDNNENLSLHGLMLSPVTPHHSPKSPASQIIVMGRFTLAELKSTLQYKINLFGTTPPEQLLEITATKKADGKEQKFTLSAKNPQANILIN